MSVEVVKEDEAGKNSPLELFTAWIEQSGATWRERGVVVSLCGVMGSNTLWNSRTLWNYHAEQISPGIDDKPVGILIWSDMGFEHACILIHNAVEQVAGR